MREEYQGILEGKNYGVFTKCTYAARTRSWWGSNFTWFGSLTTAPPRLR